MSGKELFEIAILVQTALFEKAIPSSLFKQLFVEMIKLS